MPREAVSVERRQFKRCATDLSVEIRAIARGSSQA
jgi:hypothetical protein